MVQEDKKHNYIMTRCVNCNKSTRVVETFCIHCGVIILPLPNRELYCEKCKNEVKEEDDKCYVCGTELDKQKGTDHDLGKFWNKKTEKFIQYMSQYCEIPEKSSFFPLIEEILKTQLYAYPTVELLFSQESPPLLLEWFGIIPGTEDFTEKVGMFNNKFENCMSKSFIMCYSYAYLTIAIIEHHWIVNNKLLTNYTPLITQSLYDEFKKMFNLTISFFEQTLMSMVDEDSKTTIYKQLISIFTMCCHVDDLGGEEKPKFQRFAHRQEYLEKLFSQKTLDFDRKELSLYIINDLVSFFSSLFLREAFVEASKPLIIIIRTLNNKRQYLDSRVFEILNDLFDDINRTLIFHRDRKSNQELLRTYGSRLYYTMVNTILALCNSINKLLGVVLPEDKHILGSIVSVCESLFSIDLDLFIKHEKFQTPFVVIIYYFKLCGWSSEKILDEIIRISKISDENKHLLLKPYKHALLEVEHFLEKKKKR